jgi:hypothetical protein
MTRIIRTNDATTRLYNLHIARALSTVEEWLWPRWNISIHGLQGITCSIATDGWRHRDFYFHGMFFELHFTLLRWLAFAYEEGLL